MIIGTSDPWTGFTQFTLLEEKPPDGYMWSGERLTRKQLTSRPDHLWPELWKSIGKHAKLKEKQKWSEEKLHLENARKLRGIYFIDPEDTEFKETIKNARKKLETSVAPAMPCKIARNCGSGASNKIQTNVAMVEYHPITVKNLSRVHQFGSKVLPGVFLGYTLHAGENLERRHLGRGH